jgi:hypothetical protein
MVAEAGLQPRRVQWAALVLPDGQVVEQTPPGAEPAN